MLKRPAQWLIRKPCPTCGRPLAISERQHDAISDGQADVGLGATAKPRESICPVCDGPDPLHSPKALGWARGSLRPPQRPKTT
ncbi:protein of unknown function [Bradyrhizobium sp. ORS 285]|uniref:hypothetical protein n=1 Tax=Bradyrhizobium sp. ORS 285 TaxID=115808 RepID=UPI0002407919|nr:hypothetical protein [Bradyrhizobium sp. ORS 285]CCD87947.1 hypothetical protein BRAO285_2740003 [Bradyrhizobium sp. ORS 285]SMX59979.1 protein of unknown function [Bradyrhizobium sp. ORS 285]